MMLGLPGPTNRLLVRTYTGRSYGELLDAFWRDAGDLAAQGYEPAGQHYVAGNWGSLEVGLCVLTIPLLFGIAGIAYMAANRPTGTLAVTYTTR